MMQFSVFRTPARRGSFEASVIPSPAHRASVICKPITYLFVLAALVGCETCAAAEVDLPQDAPTLRITDRQIPPSWALKQRLLLETQNDAVDKFFAHYFDQRGWYKGYLTWGMGIGSDDILQGTANWPLLYAMGGSDEVLRKFYRAFRGNLEQLSTQKVEAAPAWGVMHNGFVAADDMFHIEEWYQSFNQLPLADPNNREFRKLTLRFAGFFLNEGLPDGAEPIYDFEHHIIRSGVVGSRGAVMQIGDEFWGFGWQEVKARPSMRQWTKIRGDTLDNLGATTFVTNAWLLTGDAKYRDWVQQYMKAWCKRAAGNDHIFPYNVGLSGKVGEHWNGQWWKHMFGDWRISRSLIAGAENAALVSQNDPVYMEAIRRQARALLDRGIKRKDGRKYAPSGFDGKRLGTQLTRLYLNDFREDDLALIREEMQKRGAAVPDRYNVKWDVPIHDGYSSPFYEPPHYAWLKFLLGDYAEFPDRILDSDLGRIRFHVNRMQRKREFSQSTCGVHAGRQFRDLDWQRNTEAHHWYMPAATHSLINLAFGGMGYRNAKGSRVVMSELWHFDPAAGRPGLPPDVAALVDTITRDTVGVHLVNVSQTTPRTVVVQTGAYGEHQCSQVTYGKQTLDVNRHYFVVHLAPGSGGRLELKVKRYANQPRARLPWQP